MSEGVRKLYRWVDGMRILMAKIPPVGEEGPDDPLSPPGWDQHQSTVPAVNSLPVPRVTKPEDVLGSRKMKAAKDDTYVAATDEPD